MIKKVANRDLWIDTKSICAMFITKDFDRVIITNGERFNGIPEKDFNEIKNIWRVENDRIST